jgi:hypothetical protein
MDEHCYVVLAYGDSPYLEDCLNSLLAQTVKSNIVITTSTPSDYIENIAQKFNLEIIINLVSNGIASDWNFALNSVNFKWVTLVHQDDIYHPLFTEVTVRYFNKVPDLALHFTGADELNSNVRKTFSFNTLIKRILLFPFKIINPIKSPKLKMLVLAMGNPICCPTVTYNKKVLRDFKFKENYTYVLDWIAWIEIFKTNAPIAYSKQILLTHRIHSNSATVNELLNKKSKNEEIQVFENIWGKFGAKLFYFFYQLAHLNHLK